MMIKEYKHLMGLKTYPYGKNAFKVCESKMLMEKDLILEKLQWVSATIINVNDKHWWLRW